MPQKARATKTLPRETSNQETSNPALLAGFSCFVTREPQVNVGEAARTKQKQAKKRSLCGINEQFEPVFNTVMATQVVNRLLRCYLSQPDRAGEAVLELLRYIYHPRR